VVRNECLDRICGTHSSVRISRKRYDRLHRRVSYLRGRRAYHQGLQGCPEKPGRTPQVQEISRRPRNGCATAIALTRTATTERGPPKGTPTGRGVAEKRDLGKIGGRKLNLPFVFGLETAMRNRIVLGLALTGLQTFVSCAPQQPQAARVAVDGAVEFKPLSIQVVEIQVR
jgi:hypothetical protein